MKKLSPHEVGSAIYAAAKGKLGAELEHILQNAAAFIAQKNLLSKSEEILSHVEKAREKDENIVRAKVTSPHQLSEHAEREIKHALKERFKAREIALDIAKDPALLGGVRIETRDEVIDLSFLNKLKQLHNYLLKN
ncbi:ATP synthase F1 subunit delta [Patescibacteria group bacterium]|nr:ATP synthase F1 subunit delta [Patescibacteria group bacterium]